jgi:ATPase subunit of ABC transporter with duplicated ATPase domains
MKKPVFRCRLAIGISKQHQIVLCRFNTNGKGKLFSGEKVFQKIGTLSGGEKTRLSIATLLAKNYNLLVLDEPTTYLDVLSQRLILEALKSYKGAMIIVSHVPEFVEKIRIDEILDLEK